MATITLSQVAPKQTPDRLEKIAAKAIIFNNFRWLTPTGEMKHTIPADYFDENW
jgi:hypothetical protein